MYVCSGCNDVLMMSTNLDNIAILNINSANYHCVISRISKSKAANLLQNVDLSYDIKWVIINHNFFNCI